MARRSPIAVCGLVSRTESTKGSWRLDRNRSAERVGKPCLPSQRSPTGDMSVEHLGGIVTSRRQFVTNHLRERSLAFVCGANPIAPAATAQLALHLVGCGGLTSPSVRVDKFRRNDKNPVCFSGSSLSKVRKKLEKKG